MANKLNAARQYVLDNYNCGQDFRWDVLSNKLQMREGDTWIECDTRKINTIACHCATETGVSVSAMEVRTVLNSDDIPSVNPLREYINSVEEYDPRENKDISWIDWLSSQVHVGDAQERWKRCFKKWFVAMVAGWMDDDVVNQQVLVLIGKQGIYKTTWLEHLMPPCLRAYQTKMTNVRDLNKDERMRIAEFGLINIDEIDSMNDRELNQLKSLVTTSDVNERAAYGYTKERRIRVASFCASGNNREFLTDQTGNRRWLPFDVEMIDSPYNWGHSFPYDQIYGEAKFLLNYGFNYWFDLEDIAAMESHVESFQKISNEAELLPVYFQPANPGDAGAEFMTTAEVSALLVSYGGIRIPLQLQKLSTIMRKQGFIPKKIHGKKGFVILRNIDLDHQRKSEAREIEVEGVEGADVF